MSKIFIFGTSNYDDYDTFSESMHFLEDRDIEIFSIACGGISEMVSDWSIEKGKKCNILKGNVLKEASSILSAVDSCLFFWDCKSGTYKVINMAIAKGKPVSVVYIGLPEAKITGDILAFDGQHKWLSNTWPSQISMSEEFSFLCAESACHAAKYLRIDLEFAKLFTELSALEARKLSATKPANFSEDQRLAYIKKVTLKKFQQDEVLLLMLLLTGNCKLEDPYEKDLGPILMEVRELLRPAISTLEIPKEYKKIILSCEK